MIQIKKKIKIIMLSHQKMFKNRNELNKIIKLFIKYLEKNFLDNF